MIYNQILEKLQKDEPFSFARYGDGEWNCILSPDNNKVNCDGHKYFDTLSLALKNILLSKPKYWLGMQNHALRVNGDAINKFLCDNQLINDIQWIDADRFHKASIHNEFDKFLDLIKDKKDQVIFVAPAYLMSLNVYNLFISIPEKDCWLDKDSVVNTIKNYINN